MSMSIPAQRIQGVLIEGMRQVTGPCQFSYELLESALKLSAPDIREAFKELGMAKMVMARDDFPGARFDVWWVDGIGVLRPPIWMHIRDAIDAGAAPFNVDVQREEA